MKDMLDLEGYVKIKGAETSQESRAKTAETALAVGIHCTPMCPTCPGAARVQKA